MRQVGLGFVFAALAAASLAAAASGARTDGAASAASSSCASLTNVTGFSGTVRFAFSGSATGEDQDSGDHLEITFDRAANSIRVDLNRKLVGITGIVQFIGHAHGGQIVVQDSSRETDPNPLYKGSQTYSGPLAPNGGSALLTIDPASCTYELHVGFFVTGSFAGSKQLEPYGPVTGAMWTAREKVPPSLHLVGGDGPAVYNGGCEGHNPLNPVGSCYIPDGGWTDQFTNLALCHSPSQNNCNVSTQMKIGDATLIWVVMPRFARK
jgi:hypothetical protein